MIEDEEELQEEQQTQCPNCNILGGGANKWKEGNLITNGDRVYKVVAIFLHQNGDLI